jgi:hypothetical protein
MQLLRSEPLAIVAKLDSYKHCNLLAILYADRQVKRQSGGVNHAVAIRLEEHSQQWYVQNPKGDPEVIYVDLAGCESLKQTFSKAALVRIIAIVSGEPSEAKGLRPRTCDEVAAMVLKSKKQEGEQCRRHDISHEDLFKVAWRPVCEKMNSRRRAEREDPDFQMDEDKMTQ